MIHRILGVATLALLSAVPATAQNAYNFDVVSTGGGYNAFSGRFTTSNGPSGAGFTQNSAFQIWCVDQKNGAADGAVWASQLSGPLNKTRLGWGPSNDAAALTAYSKAAWLANDMGNGDVNKKQYAIWAIIHGKSNSQFCESWDGDFNSNNNNLSGCSTSDVGDYVGDATAGMGDINADEWYVLTDYDAIYASNGNGNYDGYKYRGDEWGSQEFIARCQTGGKACDGFVPPNEEAPTPEPATMSLLALGLAGMAGKSLRRRK